MPKIGQFGSVLKGQKLTKNAKIKNFKCDFLGDFQTLWGWKKKKIGNWILQKAKLADKWAQMKL